MNNLNSLLRRRRFLTEAVGGVGLAGMAGLLSADPFAVKVPHFPAKAKNLIFLYMEGAPSQIDLLDPKPALAKWHGQPLPASMTKDMKFAFIKPNAKVLGCNRSFARYGQSGAEFSDWVSAWGPIADDLCIVRSMHLTISLRIRFCLPGICWVGGLRWDPGCFMDWGVSRRICRALWC